MAQEPTMRLSPLSAASMTRTMRWRATGPRMRRPSPLPTVIPTKSSYLQRLLWLFMPAR